MRIGVDTRHLQMGLGTGGSHVMSHGLRAMEQFGDAHQVIPFHVGLGKLGSKSGWLRSLSALFADLLSKPLWIPLWARLNRIDLLLYFLPPCSLTENRISQCCYILDVPEQWESDTLKNKLYNDLYIGGSCKKADRILTISKAAASTIRERYGVAEEKIEVIYPCTDLTVFYPRTNPDDVEQLAQRFNLRPGFIMGVLSTLAPRKNPGGYLEMLYHLPPVMRAKHPLVFVGAPTRLKDLQDQVRPEIFRDVSEHIHFVGKVSDEELALLYSQSGALLFPSRHEGFGLPVLEAHACGTDVIASDIPAVQEAAAPVAVLLDPSDYDGMARSFQTMLADPAGRVTRSEAGVAWAQQFGYEAYAKQMTAIFNKEAKV